MDNKVINIKAKLAEIVNTFKKNLELKSGEMSENRLNLLKKCIERNEKIVNNKDEKDIEYINDELNNIKAVLKVFATCRIHKNTNSSNFIETPEWINNKKCTINPQKKITTLSQRN